MYSGYGLRLDEYCNLAEKPLLCRDEEHVLVLEAEESVMGPFYFCYFVFVEGSGRD